MQTQKRSFFERITGSVKVNDGMHRETEMPKKDRVFQQVASEEPQNILEQVEEAQLTVDMWQTTDEIVVQAIVGGVKPEDLDVSISRDMVTLRGTREKHHEAHGTDYFYQELYWGTFSRSILLPQEVDSDEAQATIKNGLLTIHLPKLDKTKVQKLKVKNE